MTKSKKSFLTFTCYALSLLLVSLCELLFVDHVTPLKLILPIVLILPVYSVLIYRIQNVKNTNHLS